MSFDVPPNNFLKFYVKFQVEQFFVLGLGPKLSDNLFGAGLEVEALAEGRYLLWARGATYRFINFYTNSCKNFLFKKVWLYVAELAVKFFFGCNRLY